MVDGLPADRRAMPRGPRRTCIGCWPWPWSGAGVRRAGRWCTPVLLAQSSGPREAAGESQAQEPFRSFVDLRLPDRGPISDTPLSTTCHAMPLASSTSTIVDCSPPHGVYDIDCHRQSQAQPSPPSPHSKADHPAHHGRGRQRSHGSRQHISPPASPTTDNLHMPRHASTYHHTESPSMPTPLSANRPTAKALKPSKRLRTTFATRLLCADISSAQSSSRSWKITNPPQLTLIR